MEFIASCHLFIPHCFFTYIFAFGFIFQIALILLSVFIVIGCLNPSILIPTLIIVFISYGLRLVFLATSRDIKRVEAVSK